MNLYETSAYLNVKPASLKRNTLRFPKLREQLGALQTPAGWTFDKQLVEIYAQNRKKGRPKR